MSRETAAAFIQRLNNDISLQKKLSGLAQGDVNGLLRIAGEAGFRFTIEEWLAAVRTGLGGTGELTEVELEQVVGGVGVINLPVDTFLKQFAKHQPGLTTAFNLPGGR
jgi:predicted ribosomally synthesized peptide with nif11-like leader